MNKLLKTKKAMVIASDCEDKRDQEFAYKNFFLPMQKIFQEVVPFDLRKRYFIYGKRKMNQDLLKTIEKVKPDYILFSMSYDEVFFKTLETIRKKYPNTALLQWFGDDTWRFDDWSRHIVLFFDYILSSEKNEHDYKKDGINTAHFLNGANQDVFKPMDTEKKYDVTFVGGAIRDRPDFSRFLKQNNINIRVFGMGWEKYPDLKDIYGGYKSTEECVEIMNQTKINLSYSKTPIPEKVDTHVKAKIFEVPACKSFLLMEHFPRVEELFKNSSKLTFKTKEELLEKVRYYLSHEKEREKLTLELYKETMKKFLWDRQFENVFSQISKKKVYHKPLPKIKKKIICISEQDFSSEEQLKQKASNSDYVYFNKGEYQNSPRRVFFQAYSLEKSKKQISCCDYYIHSKSVGDYMLFTAKKAYRSITREAFNSLVNINELMVTKKYFLENYDKFKSVFNGSQVNFIDDNNTIFVSIPLVRISQLNTADYNSMKKAFRMKFLDRLFYLSSQKKIFFSKYPYKLLLFGILGRFFIIKHLYSSIITKENFLKIKMLFKK
ncbi:glycosyltransferase [Candidatus Pacearchaeota archaeon]|nr:glycosyltransferase [Candidatus Pacearchaeota archaeon]